MSAQWTRKRVEDLGPVVDVPTAASILGCGEWTIYEQIRRGEWSLTRVLRLGRRIKIPTHDLITLLYSTPATTEAGPAATEPADANPDSVRLFSNEVTRPVAGQPTAS